MDILDSSINNNISVCENKYSVFFSSAVDYFITNTGAGECSQKEYINKNYKVILDIVGKQLKDKIDRYNYKDMDLLFDSYCDFCHIYNIIPTLEGFSIVLQWSGSNIQNLNSELKSSDSRANQESTNYIKKWRARCKAEMIETVSQEKGADVNRIFILKALHGLAETTAQAPEEIERHQTAEITSRYALNG